MLDKFTILSTPKEITSPPRTATESAGERGWQEQVAARAAEKADWERKLAPKPASPAQPEGKTVRIYPLNVNAEKTSNIPKVESRQGAEEIRTFEMVRQELFNELNKNEGDRDRAKIAALRQEGAALFGINQVLASVGTKKK